MRSHTKRKHRCIHDFLYPKPFPKPFEARHRCALYTSHNLLYKVPSSVLLLDRYGSFIHAFEVDGFEIIVTKGGEEGVVFESFDVQLSHQGTELENSGDDYTD